MRGGSGVVGMGEGEAWWNPAGIRLLRGALASERDGEEGESEKQVGEAKGGEGGEEKGQS